MIDGRALVVTYAQCFMPLANFGNAVHEVWESARICARLGFFGHGKQLVGRLQPTPHSGPEYCTCEERVASPRRRKQTKSVRHRPRVGWPFVGCHFCCFPPKGYIIARHVSDTQFVEADIKVYCWPQQMSHSSKRYIDRLAFSLTLCLKTPTRCTAWPMAADTMAPFVANCAWNLVSLHSLNAESRDVLQLSRTDGGIGLLHGDVRNTRGHPRPCIAHSRR